LEAELNLDPDSNPDPNPESDPELITDPDPNLQIISDPAGSGCTTLAVWLLYNIMNLFRIRIYIKFFSGIRINIRIKLMQLRNPDFEILSSLK
jgi:hypothetical protein